MPEILGTYDELAKNTKYEQYQDRIMDKSQYKEEGKVSFTVNNDILYYKTTLYLQSKLFYQTNTINFGHTFHYSNKVAGK